jgi:hypothetical protein
MHEKRRPPKAAPTMRKDPKLTAPPQRLYPNYPDCLVVLFDLREPGGAAELHRQRATWAEYSDIETLEEHHFVLIIRPGSAMEAAA